MPIPSRALNVTASQYSVPGYTNEPAWNNNRMLTKSLPASIPLPGSLDIGPGLPQMAPDNYSYENSGVYRNRRAQTLSYPSSHGECTCGCNGYDMGGYAHSVPRHSPSPPLLEPSCSCCPPQSQYGMHNSYYEPEPLCGSVPMSMPLPLPMPAPSNYYVGSVPTYALQPRQKPRKRVTFADPIAEIKVVPCRASSAPECKSRTPIEPFPAQPHVSGRRERRDSITGTQMLDSSFIGQSIASGLDMLTGSYTLHPNAAKRSSRKKGSHSSSSSDSKLKKRSSPCPNNGAVEIPGSTEARKSSGHRTSHERRKSDYGSHARESHGHTKANHSNAMGRHAYDERFSLSMAHLPLNTQRY
ncbi:hypothetical protein IWW50_006011 [Coemansia erecta]|nr:hypothetical protein IWW50_006011 [Coemansia erecta]